MIKHLERHSQHPEHDACTVAVDSLGTSVSELYTCRTTTRALGNATHFHDSAECTPPGVLDDDAYLHTFFYLFRENKHAL